MIDKYILSGKFSRLLDAGSRVMIYRNSLGSYTAAIVPDQDAIRAVAHVANSSMTDHFTPAQTLNALAVKAARKDGK